MTFVTQPSRAEPAIGATSTALAGVQRVGIIDPRAPGSTVLTSTLGYGFTESQLDGDGAHHRLSEVLAGSTAPLPWATVGLALTSRYDRHPSDQSGSDDGWILSSALTARAGARLGDVRIGGELVGWIPGSEDASVSFAAVSCDTKLLFAWTPSTSWVLATYTGYRWDRGDRAARDSKRMRFGDRLALGLSDYNALLAGAGGIWHHRNTELLAEVTADLLVGDGAPGVQNSPWRLTNGIRQRLLPRLKAAVLLDISLSSRPPLDAGAPLVPVDPRWSLLASVAYELGTMPAAIRPPAPRSVPRLDPIEEPTPPAPAPRRLRVSVVDDQRAPLKNAQVTLYLADRAIELVPDSEGNYLLEDAPPGRARIRIEAPGFRTVDREVEIGTDGPLALDVAVEPALPAGELRGSVRGPNGRRMDARIRVEPLHVETRTDGAGNFSIEVQPGSYEVQIDAPDSRSQRRQIQVEQNGVVILNVELSPP